MLPLNLEFFLDILQLKKKVPLEELENLLNIILIETNCFIFYCYFRQEEKKMVVEITYKSDKSLSRYEMEGFVDVSGENMRVE